jgi:hypothetical protein
MGDLKDRYIQMRNQRIVDIKFFYDFAIHSGFVGSLEEFIMAFNFVDTNILLQNMDKHYDLTSVWSKDNVFIKVI